MLIRNISRRRFLRNSATAATGLTLGFSLPGCSPGGNQTSAVADVLTSDVSAWLSISTEGLITIRVPSSEMGQGVLTALPMIIADELDADWANVRSEIAPFSAAFNNPYTGGRGTGGSSAVRLWWPSIAKAGAAAREMLVQAAAAQWGVPVAELTTAKAVVTHAASGRQASYGTLAEAAGKLVPPQDPQLKTRDQYTIIGTSAKRLDTPSKVNGSAVFGIDVKVPDMVYATTRASPTFVGRLTDMDEETALAVRGVLAVIRLPITERGVADVQQIVALADSVAVVADSYWQAKKGMDALNPQFDDGGVGDVSSASMLRDIKQALSEEGIPVRDDGDTDQALADAAQVVAAEYTVPFLAHLTMEPMNCTAHYQVDSVNGDRVELWAPTQGESHGAMVIGEVFGIPAHKVAIHTTLMGGGLGRRYEADFLVQSARLSKAVGKPVKMIWSREEDVQHDYYRPASASRFTVGLDGTGLPVAWKNAIVCPSVAQRNFSAAYANGVDPFSVEGAVNIPYAIPNQWVSLRQHDTHVPVGSWRSVGSSHNGFYVESMLDEVAHASSQDPFALRRRLLQNKPRFLTVLDLLEEKSHWLEPAPAGRYRGMAIHESFASIVGEVAEVSVDDAGAITLHRMTCVVDCGRVVNPAIVESQMESAILDGLTAALRGGVTIKAGRVEQSNFDTYRMMRMAEVPQMDIHIVQNDEPPGGVGEPGVPPSMPALANALFAATGRRIRSLPIETAMATA